MADDVVGMDLEDGPQTPPAPPAEAPPPVAEAAPPAADPDDEIATVVAGEKLVPLSALKAERQQRQALAAQVGEVEQLRQSLQQATPYVQFLQAHPELMTQQPRQEQPAPQAAPQAVDDPLALRVAKLYDFYTPDGKPDPVRGAEALSIMRGESERMSRQQVQPLLQQTAEAKSQAIFNEALAVVGHDGKPLLDRTVLSNLWTKAGAAVTCDPNQAAFIIAAAVGIQQMNGRPTVAPPALPALVTEASGGRPSAAAPRLTPLEQRVAQERGLTDKQWAERTKGFTPGRASDLE